MEAISSRDLRLLSVAKAAGSRNGRKSAQFQPRELYIHTYHTCIHYLHLLVWNETVAVCSSSSSSIQLSSQQSTEWGGRWLGGWTHICSDVSKLFRNCRFKEFQSCTVLVSSSWFCCLWCVPSQPCVIQGMRQTHTEAKPMLPNIVGWSPVPNQVNSRFLTNDIQWPQYKTAAMSRPLGPAYPDPLYSFWHCQHQPYHCAVAHAVPRGGTCFTIPPPLRWPAPVLAMTAMTWWSPVLERLNPCCGWGSYTWRYETTWNNTRTNVKWHKPN